MIEYTVDDQWRSFQTWIASYLVGMRHPSDVFSISLRDRVGPPVVEARVTPEGRLWYGSGRAAWSLSPDGGQDVTMLPLVEINDAAAGWCAALRDIDDVNGPGDLRLSGSGPASAVAVLAAGAFVSGTMSPEQEVVLHARLGAAIFVDGDAIEASAQEVGQRAFKATGNGTTAAMACAAHLAKLRTWEDPFTPTPTSGYLVPSASESADGQPTT